MAKNGQRGCTVLYRGLLATRIPFLASAIDSGTRSSLRHQGPIIGRKAVWQPQYAIATFSTKSPSGPSDSDKKSPLPPEHQEKVAAAQLDTGSPSPIHVDWAKVKWSHEDDHRLSDEIMNAKLRGGATWEEIARAVWEPYILSTKHRWAAIFQKPLELYDPLIKETSRSREELLAKYRTKMEVFHWEEEEASKSLGTATNQTPVLPHAHTPLKETPPPTISTEKPTPPPIPNEKPTPPPTPKKKPTSPPIPNEKPTPPPIPKKKPTSPPIPNEKPTSPPTLTEKPTSPPTLTEKPTSPPTLTEKPTSPPTLTKKPTPPLASTENSTPSTVIEPTKKVSTQAVKEQLKALLQKAVAAQNAAERPRASTDRRKKAAKTKAAPSTAEKKEEKAKTKEKADLERKEEKAKATAKADLERKEAAKAKEKADLERKEEKAKAKEKADLERKEKAMAKAKADLERKEEKAKAKEKADLERQQKEEPVAQAKDVLKSFPAVSSTEPKSGALAQKKDTTITPPVIENNTKPPPASVSQGVSARETNQNTLSAPVSQEVSVTENTTPNNISTLGTQSVSVRENTQISDSTPATQEVSVTENTQNAVSSPAAKDVSVAESTQNSDSTPVTRDVSFTEKNQDSFSTPVAREVLSPLETSQEMQKDSSAVLMQKPTRKAAETTTAYLDAALDLTYQLDAPGIAKTTKYTQLCDRGLLYLKLAGCKDNPMGDETACLELAMADYSAALECNEDGHKAFLGRSKVHLRMGELDGAIFDAWSACTKNPDDKSAYQTFLYFQDLKEFAGQHSIPLPLSSDDLKRLLDIKPVPDQLLSDNDVAAMNNDVTLTSRDVTAAPKGVSHFTDAHHDVTTVLSDVTLTPHDEPKTQTSEPNPVSPNTSQQNPVVNFNTTSGSPQGRHASVEMSPVAREVEIKEPSETPVLSGVKSLPTTPEGAAGFENSPPTTTSKVEPQPTSHVQNSEAPKNTPHEPGREIAPTPQGSNSGKEPLPSANIQNE